MHLIAKHINQQRLLHLCAIVFLLFVGFSSLYAQKDSVSLKTDTISSDSITSQVVDSADVTQNATDSLSVAKLPMSHRDSLIARRAYLDSIKQAEYDSIQFRRQQQPLDSKIDYSAQDSIVLYANGTAYLHGSGDVQYKDMQLKSAFIRVHMDSSVVYARGVTDSVGDLTGKPVFKEGKDEYESNEMTYNLKTKKGYIKHTVTQQGEGYIISENTKKAGDSNDMYMAGGRYTTCDDTDHPHFYLALTKAKVKPGDFIATGPAYMVVGDVPLPLAIPFGYFPITEKYSSGLIMPSYGDDFSRGFYLHNLGYYFAFNDYFDLELKGDIYTKGTWAVSAQTNYIVRYKFRGYFNFSYRNDVIGERDLPNYAKNTNMQIVWSHSQDAKASQYSTFSASVNFSTSGYNRSDIDSYYNGQLNSENTKSSSISYSQRFPDAPVSLTMSGLVNQRTKDSTIALTLPDVALTMSRVYPFKRKKAIGKEKWYEKISIQYSFNTKIAITTKENKLMQSNFLRDWQTGMKHNIPIQASWTLFKYLSVSPSITYTERWYFQRQDQRWDDEQNIMRADTTNGFYRVWDFSTGLTLSTKLYGFYTPIRKWFGDKVDRFRHVLTPSISFSYHPDFGNSWFGYYGEYQRPYTDSNGNQQFETISYNRFQGAMYGVPGKGAQTNLSFSLGNNIEMKIRNDNDTTGKQAYKVISLIDDLSITGGYNFIADSMNWNNFNVRLRLKLPMNYTLSLQGQFDPYMYGLTPTGRPVRINQLYWNHGKFPHFLGTSTSLSYTLSDDKIKQWIEGKNNKTTDEQPEEVDPLAQNNPNAIQKNNMPDQVKDKTRTVGSDGYEKTDIKWSISIGYTISYKPSNVFDYDKMYYKMKFTNNLSLSGTLSLGKGWSVSASTHYDFEAKKMAYTNFNVRRDLHCWTMTASFVPFGPYKTYNFHIGVNASMLSDLKYDKNSNSSTNARVTWW